MSALRPMRRRGQTACLIPSYWEGKFAIYRYWDKDGRLLYIGSTKNVAKRDFDHATGGSGAWWYPMATRMRIQLFPTREAALEAERLAVEEEMPAFNIHWTGRPFLDESTWTPADRRWAMRWTGRSGNRVGWWLPQQGRVA